MSVAEEKGKINSDQTGHDVHFLNKDEIISIATKMNANFVKNPQKVI